MRRVDVDSLKDFLRREAERNARLAVGKNVAETYLWWYCFLRLSDEYEQCCLTRGAGELNWFYTDWGDVFALDFPQWWEEHGRLVSGADTTELARDRSTLVRPVVEEIKTEQQLRLHDVDDPTVMLVAIHVTATTKEVQQEVARLFHAKTGRNTSDKVTKQLAREIAPYPTKHVDSGFIRRVYETYVTWVSAGRPAYPALADALKIDDGGRQAGRFVRQAQSIIQHAPHGVFPEYPAEGSAKVE
jgi:hypothetical protein